MCNYKVTTNLEVLWLNNNTHATWADNWQKVFAIELNCALLYLLCNIPLYNIDHQGMHGEEKTWVVNLRDVQLDKAHLLLRINIGSSID